MKKHLIIVIVAIGFAFRLCAQGTDPAKAETLAAFLSCSIDFSSPAGAAITSIVSEPETGKVAQDNEFVAHEWGTFTSVQGADGELIHWNPFVPGDLPDFVYNRTKAGGALARKFDLGKFNLWALQRMETPVIYFYSDREQTVNVTVDFPEGTVTEWYPKVTRFGPKSSPNMLQAEKRSFVEWNDVRIRPHGKKADFKQHLPSGLPGSHYFAARETDSAFVQIGKTGEKAQQPELEKFLFYRGLGSFKSPLRVEVVSDNELVLKNTTKETLRDLFVLSMRKGLGSVTPLKSLQPGESRNVPLGNTEIAASKLIPQISYAMKLALISEGLCEEAIGQGMPASPWDNLIGQTVLGGEGFAARLAAGLKKTDPGSKRLAGARRGSKWSKWLSKFVRRNGNGFGIGMEMPGATWRCIWDGPYAASAWWS